MCTRWLQITSERTSYLDDTGKAIFLASWTISDALSDCKEHVRLKPKISARISPARTSAPIGAENKVSTESPWQQFGGHNQDCQILGHPVCFLKLKVSGWSEI
jgi:hypothetical protein